MAGNFLTLLSAAAFAVFVFRFASFLSAFCRGWAGQDGFCLFDCLPLGGFTCGAADGRAMFALSSLLLPFYLIPIGSLPPFVSFGGLGSAAVAALICAARLALAEPPVAFRRAVRAAAFPAVLCAACAPLAFAASRAGAPGELFAPEFFAATPLWSLFGAWGKAGMFFAFLALLIVFPEASPETRDCCGARRAACALERALCAAILVNIFAPWNFSKFAGIGGAFGFFSDFIFFWIKTFAVGAPAARLGNFAARSSLYLFALPFAVLCALCLAVEAGAL